EKSIFILPEIEPLDLAYEFDPVQKAAFNRHYVFISTQAPYEKWKTSETAKTFWRELPEDGLYTSEALLDYLLERLTEAKEQLPSDIAAKVETGVDSQPVFIGELTCVQIAEMLKTPDNIARFV